MLENIPVPDDTVPLEAVLAFRSDERVQMFYRDLKVWMARAARSELTERELAGEFEARVANCERYMADHRVQARMAVWIGVVRAITTGSLLGFALDQKIGG